MNSRSSTNPFKVRQAERLKGDDFLETLCAFPKDLGLRTTSTVILEGARGSGKSTALREVGTLPRVDTDNTSDDGRTILGVYISFGPGWFSAFRDNPQASLQQKQTLFCVALNLALALEASRSLERFISFLGRAPDAALSANVELARLLTESVFVAPARKRTLADSRKMIEECWIRLNDAVFRSFLGEGLKVPADIVLADAVVPLQTLAGRVTEEVLGFSDVLWVALLDEVDLLDEAAQSCINGAIRGVQDPVALKLACLPHGHRTKSTRSSSVSIASPHDFEYRAVLADPKDANTREFCQRIYSARRSRFAENLPPDPSDWVGNRPLRQRAEHFLRDPTWDEAVVRELDEHEGRLLPARQRTEASIRQHVPSLAMRLLKSQSTGNQIQPMYAGWHDLISASDGNPRRLLRLLDRMYEAADGETSPLPEATQTRAIISAAEGAFDRLVSLPSHGAEIKQLVSRLGDRLEELLHDRGLTSSATSLTLSVHQSDDATSSMLQTAVSYGVLVPWPFAEAEGFPLGTHQYSLSFGIAPRFHLVLRRGRSALRLEQLLLDSKSKQLSFLLQPLEGGGSDEGGTHDV